MSHVVESLLRGNGDEVPHQLGNEPRPVGGRAEIAFEISKYVPGVASRNTFLSHSVSYCEGLLVASLVVMLSLTSWTWGVISIALRANHRQSYYPIPVPAIMLSVMAPLAHSAWFNVLTMCLMSDSTIRLLVNMTATSANHEPNANCSHAYLGRHSSACLQQHASRNVVRGIHRFRRARQHCDRSISKHVR